MEAFEKSLEHRPANKITSISSQQGIRLITGFSSNFKSITSVMRKHWHILQSDSTLGSHLPDLPQVVFRRACTLKNMVAQSILKSMPSKPTDIRGYFNNWVGIFQSKNRGCFTCQSIPLGHSLISDSSGKIFSIKQFIVCSTQFVIYVLKSTLCGPNDTYPSGRTL